MDAGCGHTFATLDQPLQGLTDVAGKVPAARHLRRSLVQLAQAQSWLERTEKGSRRHRKALTRVQRLQHKVASRRATWQRQVAVALAERFETIVVETLSLKGMIRRTKGFRFSKTLSDNAFGLFFQVLEAELVARGGQLVRVGRFFPSSRLCSGCGTTHVSLALSDRVYTCTTCGLVVDRDVNAARNLAAWLDPDSDHLFPDALPGHATSVGEPSSRQTSSSGDDDAAALDTQCPEGTCSLTESSTPALAAAVV